VWQLADAVRWSARYGGMPVRSPYSKEAAIRILLANLQRQAAAMSKVMVDMIRVACAKMGFGTRVQRLTPVPLLPGHRAGSLPFDRLLHPRVCPGATQSQGRSLSLFPVRLLPSFTSSAASALIPHSLAVFLTVFSWSEQHRQRVPLPRVRVISPSAVWSRQGQ
jgi:hypothetical protein